MHNQIESVSTPTLSKPKKVYQAPKVSALGSLQEITNGAIAAGPFDAFFGNGFAVS